MYGLYGIKSFRAVDRLKRGAIAKKVRKFEKILGLVMRAGVSTSKRPSKIFFCNDANPFGCSRPLNGGESLLLPQSIDHQGIFMKTSFKLASLAALTAATLALPAAAQDMKDPVKCHPKTGMAKCGAKKHKKSAKCGANKEMMGAKCAAKCAPKCGAKCAAKN